MSNEELTFTKKLSGLFASFTVLVMGGANLIMTMSIDFSTLVFVLTKLLPLAILMGYLGHLIGGILDNPRRKKR